MRIGLVGCVKTKLPSPAPAGDLYVSPLFRGRRDFVERTCDRWFVLSAKHGLVEPQQILEPYDETLAGRPSSELRAWAGRVVRELKDRLGPLREHTFEVHAGAAYRNHHRLSRGEQASPLPAGPLRGGAAGGAGGAALSALRGRLPGVPRHSG